MSVVAIVGRPNVGKSTLFNKIIGQRKALVSDMPGVTRDRHYGEADWCGVGFTVIDTGGLSFDESDKVEAKVHMQSLAALDEADVVICLFDGRDEITNLDRDVVDIFRKSDKDVVYAVNKIDTEVNEGLALTFSELGLDIIPISAEHNRNLDDLLDKIIELLPIPEKPKELESKGMRIAIVGRPNVGKSTIINHLASEDRVIAHNRPGTTRDCIDVEITYKGSDYVFVDTAGVKKRAKTREKIDKFSTLKSLKAVEHADLTFVVLDAEEGFTRQDITLAAHSFNLYRPTAILVNKWDTVKKTEKEYIKYVRENLGDLKDLLILCISGKTGYNCNKIYSYAANLDKAKKRRVSTGELNKFLKFLTEHHPSPDYRGKHVKLNYITQADINPPVFVVFVNQPKGIKSAYRKYLINRLRALLGETMVPIVIKFRAK
jgi:GTP-binding protein